MLSLCTKLYYLFWRIILFLIYHSKTLKYIDIENKFMLQPPRLPTIKYPWTRSLCVIPQSEINKSAPKVHPSPSNKLRGDTISLIRRGTFTVFNASIRNICVWMNPRGAPGGATRKSRSGPPVSPILSRKRGGPPQSPLKKLQRWRTTPRRETLIEAATRYPFLLFFHLSISFLALSLFLYAIPFYFPDPNISADTTYFVSFIVPGSVHGYLSAVRYRIRRLRQTVTPSRLSFWNSHETSPRA